MKLTNRAGLHPSWRRAILAQAKSHPTMQEDPRFCSVTEAIDPACKIALTRRYWAQLTEECEDRLYALVGSALHVVVAQGADQTSEITEKRLPLIVDGERITGGLDNYLLNEGWLTDHKYTTVWSMIFKNRMGEWTAQANIYAEMLRQYVRPVRKITIEALFRDWSKRDAARDPKYPQKKWATVPIDVWPTDKVMAYVSGRIQALKVALEADVPVECTKEERWDREFTWAVYRGKNKRATRVFKEESKKETREDAQNYILAQAKPGDYHIEDRPGVRVRCQDYCVAAQVCPHWKAHQENLYGRDFGPDKDEETRPVIGDDGPKDFFGATPEPASVRRTRRKGNGK